MSHPAAVYEFLCENTLSFLWDRWGAVPRLGHMGSPALVLRGTATPLSSTAVPSYFPTSNVGVIRLLPMLTNLAGSLFFILAIPAGVG